MGSSRRRHGGGGGEGLAGRGRDKERGAGTKSRRTGRVMKPLSLCFPAALFCLSKTFEEDVNNKTLAVRPMMSFSFFFLLQTQAAAPEGGGGGREQGAGGGSSRGFSGRSPGPFSSRSPPRRHSSSSPSPPRSRSRSRSPLHFREGSHGFFAASSSSSSGAGPFRASSRSVDLTVLRLARGRVLMCGALRSFGEADTAIRMLRHHRIETGEGAGPFAALPERLLRARQVNELATERSLAEQALERLISSQRQELGNLQAALNTRDIPFDVRSGAFRQGVKAAELIEKVRDRLDQSRRTNP